ncbi:MAG TPA: hypothetical protein DEG17_19765 [Cyanobacteria bacterium UBA11149]|nr:hypothetical protein [Cyanobacteria bacterium UBA11367]HBE61052.1 hypothetical protein [Cyanobacteria bacterium UBA11366]HBK62284.1 hypothetical protein [Cyanobacteria bacterium UBA11166]HBR74238.1 hypothetical protein [Cyanobacteria bacterium UBA11159]HBS69865.1 hypothetical protein [Cyanobacteria bacterium UBA11153]HBW91037.1 hypothetical protein [Cyanobacteria bacterium UBA11149]HCA95030.1 hypothetical protein [Cyanobacteria bacterium UBA9226]
MYGSSVGYAVLHDLIYRERLVQYFDWWYPDQGFNWMGLGNEKAREVIDLAVKHGKKLRGNSLASATFKVTSDVTKKSAIAHLEAIISQFPEIICWDAIHESMGDNGHPRNCAWRKGLGSEWEKLILTWANKIRPDIQLFYCDYFRTKIKWKSCYEKIKSWVENGISIHGVSIQLHSNLRPSVLGRFASLNIKEAEYWMKKFKDLGLLLHVPEIVVWQPARYLNLSSLRGKSNVYKEIIRKGLGDYLLASSDVEALQCKVYRQIVDMCVRCGADLIGFWSAFDAYPWNWVGNRAKAGLWDEDFIPKKSFYQLFGG